MSVLSAPFEARTWRSTAHVVLDLFVSIVTFTIVVTLLSLTLSLAITFVLAVPCAWLLVSSARWLGDLERARAAALLDLDVASPHPSEPGTWFSRLRGRFTSVATWKEIAYHLALLPLGTVGASLVIGAWSSAIVLFALPALPHDSVHLGLTDLDGSARWIGPPAGAIAVVAAAWIARGWAGVDRVLVRSLLGPGEAQALSARVDALTSTRSLAVDAAEQERRRIERDLHDGAQQRLVALSIDLGMARAKFDDDPVAARALLDAAHQESKLAIAELRDLARGIHPVALTDRGLPGALPELAARAPFPVDVRVDLPDRPAPAIEGIAYFIVAEALTNAAKHADARRATVEVSQRADRLELCVTDDGRGGADPNAGAGLRGLAQRAASVDGTLVVDSPPGGPTRVVASLPCHTAAPR